MNPKPTNTLLALDEDSYLQLVDQRPALASGIKEDLEQGCSIAQIEVMLREEGKPKALITWLLSAQQPGI